MFDSLDAYKVIMVAINLIILYLVLKKLLFKRVTEFMENRTRSIKESLENAENARTEVAQLKLEYQKLMGEAHEKGEKIVDDARMRALSESEKIMAEARQKSENLLSKAMDDIQQERQQMMKELRNQVAGLALAAASKVMEANMDTEANRVLVDRFIDEAGAA